MTEATASAATGASVENVVIVGSGPAGYTAAIYAARANLRPVVITGFQDGGIPGGQLMTTTHVENFPGFPDGILGPDLMDRLKAQAVRWGTRLVEADADSIDLSQRPFRIQADGQTIEAQSVILATGASANRLGLPSEERFWNAGISACAICDGATPQFRNEELAVVGGGDSACEEAVYLTKYGSRVHLVVRSGQLRASKAMADRVLANPNITVHWNRQIRDCSGGDWMEAIDLVATDGSGGSEQVPVRGLFYAIGHTPNTRLLRGQLEVDSHGYLVTKPGRPETSLEGVFAAGDVADAEWRQGITAAGSGCQAALAAERWLTHHDLAVTVSQDPVDPAEVGEVQRTAVSDEANFDPNALWQKGGYALRKLYHDSEKPLLVVYTSPTCGPCHVLKPQLKRVLDELGGRAQGVEIDIEADQEIAQQAGVSGTPTVQLFFQKELKQQFRGVKQRSEFKAAIEQLLGAAVA
ncbi:MAG: thioredoxin-disulfide reductase [Vulcanococcus sp.]|uniref:thioredoxin-disulfide reductase n=1 Tax=Vulcanococcus sp. TaxID=2856995 RepID=UPI0025F40929|nr:thioredoxin-disulfide reductase [Vulcanococcus sp.]MBW0168363.1 thioredoxin-disulfide reductase [Vulcanococcus sp.]